MLPRPDTCLPCALHPCASGFSFPTGSPRARLALVGEALGQEEARTGEAFVGTAGGMLSRLLLHASIDRRDLRVDNIVACRPPNDYLVGAPWERDAVDYCPRTHLAERTLRGLPSGAAVVALGAVASRRLLNRAKTRWNLDHWHSTVRYIPPGEGLAGTGDYYVIPTYHPSFLQRGAHGYMPAVIFALQRAAWVAEHGWPAAHTPSYQMVIDPPAEWFAAWIADIVAQAMQNPEALWLNIDTEFVEKTGQDEDSLAGSDTTGVTITHVNVAVDPNVGVTVPYVEPFRSLVKQLVALPLRKLFWHAPADVKPLLADGATLGGLERGRIWDLMQACHALQSDYPMNLGFWGPFGGDQPAWKHLAHTGEPEDFGVYRAFDAFVPLRIAYHVIPELHASGQLVPMLDRHFTAVDVHAFWPSRDVGLQVDKPALEAFREKLVTASLGLLDKINATMADAGKLTPKEGMREKPAEGTLPPGARPKKVKGKVKVDTKREWIGQHSRLVEREIDVETQVCLTCRAEGVSVKHRCQRVAVAGIPFPGQPGILSRNGKWWHPTADVQKRVVTQRRWFWLEPFNVDSPQQLLAAILSKGHTPGTHKKTKKATTDKTTLAGLALTTNDPLYQGALDYRAVKKVLGTYVEGTLARLVAYPLPNGLTIYRIHGEITRRPSTHRTSAVNPNLQNVVADKHGKESLAAGFRLTIRAAREGEYPAWAWGPEGAAWAARWLEGEAWHSTT